MRDVQDYRLSRILRPIHKLLKRMVKPKYIRPYHSRRKEALPLILVDSCFFIELI